MDRECVDSAEGEKPGLSLPDQKKAVTNLTSPIDEENVVRNARKRDEREGRVRVKNGEGLREECEQVQLWEQNGRRGSFVTCVDFMTRSSGH